MTGSGRSVLLLEPPFGCDGHETCLDLLTDSERRPAALSVLYREPVDERMARINRYGDAVESAAIVAVSPGADEGVTGAASHEAVRTLSDPADLTGLGIAITDWLDARSEGTPATVCLDSVSTLLQYVDRDRALKFLYTMTSRFRRAGVEMHCHLDPQAHDERTVAQLRQLFDDERRPDSAARTAAASRAVATDGGTDRDVSLDGDGAGEESDATDGDTGASFTGR